MEELVPYIEGIRTVGEGDDMQYIARVAVERSEIIAHDDRLPHFEGRQYRSLGSMMLIDGEDWKMNPLGREVRSVEVGVVPIEPDGSSFIKFRMSSKLLTWPDGEKIIARGRKKVDPVALMDQAIDSIPPLRELRDALKKPRKKKGKR